MIRANADHFESDADHSAGKMMRVLLVLIALLTATQLCPAENNAEDTTDYRRGKAEAEHDIQHKTVRIKTYGLPTSWRETYARLLNERYGIQLETVAGCCVTHELVDEVRGYNEVSQAFIIKTHGTNFLSSVQDDARKLHDREDSIKTAQLLGLSSGKNGENEFVIQTKDRGLVTCRTGDEIRGFTVTRYDEEKEALLVLDSATSNTLWITSGKDKSRTSP